jgi:hypothetical protein
LAGYVRESGSNRRIGSDVRSSTTSSRERAVLVRERARGTVRVEECETHWLARGFSTLRVPWKLLRSVAVISGAAALTLMRVDSSSRAKASVIALSAVFAEE